MDDTGKLFAIFIHGLLVLERTLKDYLAIFSIPRAGDFHAIDIVTSEVLSIATVIVDAPSVFLVVLEDNEVQIRNSFARLRQL